LSFYAYYLLPLAWVIDGGLGRFGKTAREPLVIGMLLLCFVLALGILWSDHPDLASRSGEDISTNYFPPHCSDGHPHLI
jgi:hypothetical protein